MLDSTTQHSNRIPESELVLNADNSVYHLNLHPEDIGDTILLAGDQGRVEKISRFFDQVDIKKQKREFVTHTGLYKGHRVTALSTGIGCDNIDIVVNELDALVNIDLQSRTIKENKKSLRLVRLGTCGALQEDIDVDTTVVSSHGLGLDGVMHFYEHNTTGEEELLLEQINNQLAWPEALNPLYIASANKDLLKLLAKNSTVGITATGNGFYGPQGRQLRLKPSVPSINDRLRSFKWEGHRIYNYEMETSALLGLSSSLGHQAITVCAVIANRYQKTFSENYHKTVDIMIGDTLESLF